MSIKFKDFSKITILSLFGISYIDFVNKFYILVVKQTSWYV